MSQNLSRTDGHDRVLDSDGSAAYRSRGRQATIHPLTAAERPNAVGG